MEQPNPAEISWRPRIPERLNITLCVLIALIQWGLQWLAAHQRSAILLSLCAVFFAMLMNPLYTLLHDAMHNLFSASPRINDRFGRLLGFQFMGPFYLLRQTHMGHHRRNRSDAEAFDSYTPEQSRLWRTLLLHGIRIGLFWLSIPLLALLFLVTPRGTRSRFLTDPLSSGAMILGIPESAVPAIRLETFVLFGLHALLFWTLDLTLWSYGLLYASAAFVWSSQNYVPHAFSPRDVMNGAHNMQMPRWLEAFSLNFNYHLAHHQHPSVPWKYLPTLVDPSLPRPSYLGTWLELWKGPRPVQEGPPQSLDKAYEARARAQISPASPLSAGQESRSVGDSMHEVPR